MNRVLLATIRNIGAMPCPRCETPKQFMDLVGTTSDWFRRQRIRVDDALRRSMVISARKYIFTHGVSVASKTVEDMLKPKSWVPTRVCKDILLPLQQSKLSHYNQNAFSETIGSIDSDFNFFQLFVPDLMHESELGVWKAFFTQLIRLLYTLGADYIALLNVW
jgi:hypothetical protein